MSEQIDVPGTSPLTPEQQTELHKRYGYRYVTVADGSYGGHTPGRKYGHGALSATVKTRGRTH